MKLKKIQENSAKLKKIQLFIGRIVVRIELVSRVTGAALNPPVGEFLPEKEIETQGVANMIGVLLWYGSYMFYMWLYSGKSTKNIPAYLMGPMA